MPEIQYKSQSSYVSAMLLSLPIAAVIWFVIIYPVYGITGETIHPYYHIVTTLLFYIIVWGWALYGSDGTPEVVYRLCRFGTILSLLLPVSTGVTSVLWGLNAAERQEAFLAGFTALEIPVYAAGVALLLIILFLTGSYLAARDMEGIPF